ncbi:hypothetical protein TNIN_158111 [Trichonephila inaurata madagascariensis]|uniref:MANSC domain-containing protein n=1 Tax=Trichonephila inaurata madagascariensis TaxID=2747483 RepID=A0A8X6MEM9_9ARAC|nr:hypothetical protein TNIN_158111 [Trichonephila inaurata madagascariensis]
MSQRSVTVFSYLIFVLIIVSCSHAFENDFVEPRETYKPELNSVKSSFDGNLTHSLGNFTRYNRQLDTSVESRFHITKNTIIRTGESRILGAKYLNETFLPDNHDCLTWCLETPNCNAVVYEEKNVHSCYMFDCGSPSTFLCKFTPHEYFISSVLKVTQHSYDLHQWGNQVKHEKELAELRISDVQDNSSQSPVEQKTMIVTSDTPLNLNSSKPANKCHHYQFMCVNNSECIAIYNVCDGIPQCPDGSDESVDLKCHMKEHKDMVIKTQPPYPVVESPHPTETKAVNVNAGLNRPPLPSPPVHILQNVNVPQNIHATENMHAPQNLHIPQNVRVPQNARVPQITRIPQANVKLKIPFNRSGTRRTDKSKSIWPDRIPENQPSRSDYYHNNDDSDGLGSPFIHKHSQFVAANDPHVQSLNRWSSDYDTYPSHSSSLDQPYNSYEGNYHRSDDQYLPNSMSPEYDGMKSYGNYRQDDAPYWTNQDAPDNNYPAEDFPEPPIHKSNNYPDKESLYAQQLARTAAQYPETKHPIIHKPMDILPDIQQNRASEIEEYKSRRFPMSRQPSYMAYEEALEKQLSGYPDLKPKHYNPSQTVDDSMYSNDDLIRASLVNQLPIELDRPHHMFQYGKHAGETAMPHVLNKNRENIEEKVPSTEEPMITLKPTTPPKSVQRTVLDFKMSVTELYQASRTHSQEANSAILALVMGLTITVLLFVFLACRIKTIRKRMSRKGRALAHDADYLVNGMYL